MDQKHPKISQADCGLTVFLLSDQLSHTKKFCVKYYEKILGFLTHGEIYPK